MAYPFPGMNPYLERASLWPDVHLELIRASRFSLTQSIPARYYISAEERTYIAANGPDSFVGRHDVAIVGVSGVAVAPLQTMTANGSPATVVLPVPEEVSEHFLEIREAATHRVVTVIEILSPANKASGEGRRQYEIKRQQVLGSATSLVEIDLLRSGQPLPAQPQAQKDYRILVSRGWERPKGLLYSFDLPDPIPPVPIPLQRGEEEVSLALGDLIPQIYEDVRYERRMDYTVPPPPPDLTGEQSVWLDELLRTASLR
ncbi:MAG: DUF4058 family protein [Caldilineaceae bacterium]